jgi:hypothetical protein
VQHSNAALAASVIPRSQHRTHLGLDEVALVYNRAGRFLTTATGKRWHQRALLVIGTVSLLSLAACSTRIAAPSLEGKPRSGYVEMSQVQAAYIGSGSAGHGTLRFRGSTYPFNVGGLGVGGIGVSTIEAREMSTGSSASATSRAHTRRAAMASPWALQARGTCGCRTNMA